jgi:hypothetical protein
MKKVAMGVMVGLLFLAIVTTASANLAQFVGKWKNTNPNTKGLTTLSITLSGTQVMVHAWGQCTPTDCDWGNMPGFAYAPNVSSNLQATAEAISVVHKESFAERLLIIRHPAGNHLRVETYTRFTDGSGRTNYVDAEMFAPAAALSAPIQRSPANHSTFGNYPRTTKLDWDPVPGASKYTVEIDCFGCCQANKWCTDVGKQWSVVPNLTATEYTFNFVGAQPGRWRVWAVGPGGETSPKTGWWEFNYTK